MDQAGFSIKPQYVIEMFGGIQNDRVVERLPIGASATTARGDFDLVKFLAPGHFHDDIDVFA